MATRVDRGPDVEFLKMIEGVITRMAGNSFLLKGWAVTLVAGLTAFSRADADSSFALIAVFVVVVFGTLDAYYLALERLYRALYREAASRASTQETWSLDTGPPSTSDLWSALRSPSVFLLHGVALIVALAVVVTGT